MHHVSCLQPPPSCWLPVQRSGGWGWARFPGTLTADAFGVADFPTADGVVVLLVAHQRVHAQDRWRG